MTDSEPVGKANLRRIKPRSPNPDDDDPLGMYRYRLHELRLMRESEEPEIIAIDSQKYPGPGVLAVTIHEGLGLSVPSKYEDVFKHELGPWPTLTASSEASGSVQAHSKHQPLPYAILEFDCSQITIQASSGTRENPVWEPKRDSLFSIRARRFDVFRAGELTIRLYIRHPHSDRGSQDLFLGAAKTSPLFERESTSQTEWLPIKNGTGKLYVGVQYIKSKTLLIQIPRKPKMFESSRLGCIGRARKLGSDCCYATVTVLKADVLSDCDVVQALLSPINDNSFIAPIKFIAQTRTKLCLFWPFIPCGHLFYYLQRANRFHIDRARLYAAEILIALECVHSIDPSYYQVKPKNILLDSMGHVILCDTGLFHLEANNMESTFDIPEDYLSPELLSRVRSTNIDTTASKWWTLGVFLYEMLMGLPPFYDEIAQERRRKIFSEPLEISNLLPASAQDLLTKLLSRNSKDRLGANGPSEVKVHPFFDELDWDKVARREYECAFKPSELAVPFREHRQMTLEEMIHQFDGFSYVRPAMSTVVPTAVKSHSVVIKSPVVNVEKKEDWDIVWQMEDHKFYFYSRITEARKVITARRPNGKQITEQHSQATSAVHQEDSNVSDLPNASQRQAALEAVLQNKYMHLVPVLLKKYSMNLNFDLSFARQTPLEYVTKMGDLKTAELFLSHGADATATLENSYTLGGLPLLIAVQEGNHELVKLLVQRTDRVPCTRALGHAVSKRNISIVNILLANGVKCDFEVSDRPPSSISRGYSDWDFDGSCSFGGDASEPEEYTPPLIRAVILGDLDLIQLLLAHGADVNVGYHDLSFLSGWSRHMDCGRPIQLAMELEHHNVVRLLLDYGADINLAQPVWRHHDCDMVPREAFLQIMSRLSSAVATTTSAQVTT